MNVLQNALDSNPVVCYDMEKLNLSVQMQMGDGETAAYFKEKNNTATATN